MKTAVLLSVGLSLLAGSIYGDERRRRLEAEENSGELMRMMEEMSHKTPAQPDVQLKKMAGVLNDAHKRITAVSKALLEPAS
jgi:hypothetical protein